MNQASWETRDAEVCWHPYTQHALDRETLPVVRASGAWLELADGRRVLDAISSWWAILHGHAHPKIVSAIQQQAEKLDHVLFAGCTHEPAVKLAEGLLELAPQGLSKVFYSDSGATSVEVALKAAYLTHLRQGKKGRNIFLALHGSYHGDTVGAMSVSDPQPFFQDLAQLLFQVERVSPTADSLRQTLEAHAGKVAGFIVEPLIQGAAGMVMHPPSFLKEARKLCTEHGVFLIADEVATGFGRTGTVFACDQASITPDLLCLAKGLSGGVLPLAATLATEEIYESFLSDDRASTFFHGHTFTANPIACAAGCASLEILKEENTPRKLDAIGACIENHLVNFAKEICVADLRRLGGIVALEISAPDSGYFAKLGDALRAACKASNVLLRPSGNVLYAIPPSCTTPEECKLIADAMKDVAMHAVKNISPQKTP